jgi:hypothetical protein
VSKGNIIMSEMMEIAPGYASEFAEDFIRRKFLIVVGARNDGWRNGSKLARSSPRRAITAR